MSNGSQGRSAASQEASVTIQDAAIEYIRRLDGGPKIYRTGLPELDLRIGGGVELGEVVIVASRPGHGKSAIGQQMLYSFSEQGLTSLFLTVEMGQDRVSARFLQHLTSLPREHWQSHEKDIEGDIEAFCDQRAKIYIVDSARTLDEIRSQIIARVEKHGVRAIAVDYVQLINAPGRTEYDQVTNVSKEIAWITKEFDLITVLLAQAGRDVERRSQAKPKVSVIPEMCDLRGSGQLEQDASVIVFGVYPCKYSDKQPVDAYLMKVAKCRNRESDESPFPLTFNPTRMKFGPVGPEA